MPGLLVVITGPSGVGKGTVIKRLLEKNSRLHLSISSTTRSPRPGEENGKDYFFLSEEEFISKVENDEFIEWAEVHGKRYGTEKSYIDKKIRENSIVLLEIDVQGAEIVNNKSNNALMIFIAPPSFAELERRLRNRKTETEEQIEKRLHTAKQEMKKKDIFDHILINNEIDQTADEINQIIKFKRRMLNK